MQRYPGQVVEFVQREVTMVGGRVCAEISTAYAEISRAGDIVYTALGVQGWW